MYSTVVRVVANSVILVGLILLVRAIHQAATGVPGANFFAQSQSSWTSILCALGVTLPIPFHVISVGFFLQRRWLCAPVARAAWVAVIVSGCWLGLALGIRWLIP